LKPALKKMRQWMMLGSGGVVLLALIGGGEPVRGAMIAMLGALIGRIQAR
jgi:hypothetical protein